MLFHRMSKSLHYLEMEMGLVRLHLLILCFVTISVNIFASFSYHRTNTYSADAKID